MKKLFIIIIIFISFQSWTKADDIKNFQIEGMTIGDNALDFFNKKEINNNKSYIYNNQKYFGFYKDLSNSTYDGVQVSLNSDFIIHGVTGKIFYENNISQCYETMNSIEKDLDSLFPNAETRKQNRKHRADPSGKSTIKDKSYFLTTGDAIQISCNDWSKYKHKITGKITNYTDELKVSMYSFKFIDFLNDENY